MVTLMRSIEFSLLKVLLVGCLICGLGACASSRGGAGQDSLRKVPETRVTALDDGSYNLLGNFYGQRTLVLFWAEWCPHSRAAMMSLKSKRGDLEKEGTTVVAVSLDPYQRYEQLKDFIDYHELGFMRHFFSGNGEEDEAYLSFKAEGLPHLYVLDQKGMIQYDGHSVGSAVAALKDVTPAAG